MNGWKRYMQTISSICLNSIHSMPAKQVNPNQPVLIHVHGAFGNCQDFYHYNKKMASLLKTPVYSVDLRNHGKSANCLPNDSWTLAGDLVEFMRDISSKHNNSMVDLIGFSLGGKVALLSGLDKKSNNILNKVVSIDMPPGVLPSLDEIAQRNYTEIMRILQAGENFKLHKGNLNKRETHHLFVKKTDNDQSWIYNLNKHFAHINFHKENLVYYFTSGFLEASKNLKAGEPIKFNIPLLEIGNYLQDICDWPTEILQNANPLLQNTTVRAPVLFLRAAESPFFSDLKMFEETMKRVYSNHKCVTFECGHPIHVEKQKEYIDEVTRFLKVAP